MTDNTNISLGKQGERLACEYLQNLGYKIIWNNYKTKIGEVDIVARDEGCLVFVEVKTRTNDLQGHPLEAVDRRKQAKLRQVAHFIMLKEGYSYENCRFDVVAVSLDCFDDWSIELVKDAIEIGYM